MHAIQTIETYPTEYTFLLCECCFDIILEDDAQYHGDNSYCHHCIEEIRI
jgi:hypothetical protein